MSGTTRFKEEWKIIRGFPLYAVSTYGRVVNTKAQRLLTPVAMGKNYYVLLTNTDQKLRVQVCKLVCAAFNLFYEMGRPVYHRNGDTSDNRFSNLALVDNYNILVGKDRTTEAAAVLIAEDPRWTVLDEFPAYMVHPDGEMFSMFKGDFLKPKINMYGFKEVTLVESGKRKYRTLHRLIGRAFLDDFDPDRTIEFLDGDKLNCRVENLKMTSRTSTWKGRRNS